MEQTGELNHRAEMGRKHTKKRDLGGSFGDPRKIKAVVTGWIGLFGRRNAMAAPHLVGLKQPQEGPEKLQEL